MKKLLTTALLAATLAGSCYAYNVENELTWYQGSSFTSKTRIDNMTVKSLARVYGMFETTAGLTINADNENPKKATVTGPNGYSFSTSITQPSKYSSDGSTLEMQPGIMFNCSNKVAGLGLTTPGEYTCSIPAGAFTVNGEANDAFSVKFTVVDNTVYTPTDFDFSVSPDPSLSVDQIKDVTLTINNLNSEGKPLYAHKGVSPTLKTTLTTPSGDVDCTVVTTSAMTGKLAWKISVPAGTDFSTAGKYTITVPEGMLRLTGQNVKGDFTNTAYKITYNVTGNASKPEEPTTELTWRTGTTYLASKAVENGIVQQLEMLYGVAPTGKTLRVNSGRPMSTISGPENYSKEAEITQVMGYDYSGTEPVMTEQNAFSISCMSASGTSVKVPGVYTINIPAGAFSIDGTNNDAIELKIEVKNQRTYQTANLVLNVSPDPSLPLEKLVYFEVSFNNIQEKDGKEERIYTTNSVVYGAKGTVTKLGGSSVEIPFKTNGLVVNPSRNIGYKLDFDEVKVAFKEDGVYDVVIPAGQMELCTENGTWYTNAEIKYRYTVGNGSTDIQYTDKKPAISPKEGEVNALAGIRLDAYDMSPLYLYLNTTDSFKLTLADGTVKDVKPTTYPSGAMLDFFFDEIYTAPGTYKLSIPKGSYMYINNDNPAERYLTNGFDIEYTVKGGETADLAFSLSSADGDELSTEKVNDTYKINHVYLKFNETVTPTEMIMSKVTDPEEVVTYARTSWSSGNQRFMIDLGVTAKKPGVYTIEVPAGAAMNADGKFNEKISFRINYLEQKTEGIPCTSNPENGMDVAKLDKIYINAPAGYKKISPALGGITKTYLYNDAFKDDKDKTQMAYLHQENDTRLSITLDKEVTEKGDYTLEIPAGSILGVKDDGTQVLSSAMTFVWGVRDLGAVEGIGIDGVDSFDVYDMNGVNILKNGTKDDLNRLGKGVYIINGRKYILR